MKTCIQIDGVCNNCGGSHAGMMYRSPFTQWDSKATVRTAPLRSLQMEREDGKLFFSRGLIPAADHPIITERGAKVVQTATLYSMATYMDFTESLEHEAVNRVLFTIARGNLGVVLPAAMAEDAYKIYTDEGYHALFSARLKNQAFIAAGVKPLRLPEPWFLGILHRAVAELPNELQDLGRVVFAIVSETLITGTLTKIPSDESVLTTVRELIDDHAKDERRHHAFFAQLLHFLWPQLRPCDREVLGKLLPRFLLGFLSPDIPSIRAWLSALDLSPNEVEAIIAEKYSRDVLFAGIRSASRPTVEYCKSAGVLELPSVRDAFYTAGLLD